MGGSGADAEQGLRAADRRPCEKPGYFVNQTPRPTFRLHCGRHQFLFLDPRPRAGR